MLFKKGKKKKFSEKGMLVGMKEQTLTTPTEQSPQLFGRPITSIIERDGGVPNILVRMVEYLRENGRLFCWIGFTIRVESWRNLSSSWKCKKSRRDLWSLRNEWVSSWFVRPNPPSRGLCLWGRRFIRCVSPEEVPPLPSWANCDWWVLWIIFKDPRYGFFFTSSELTDQNQMMRTPDYRPSGWRWGIFPRAFSWLWDIFSRSSLTFRSTKTQIKWLPQTLLSVSRRVFSTKETRVLLAGLCYIWVWCDCKQLGFWMISLELCLAWKGDCE